MLTVTLPEAQKVASRVVLGQAVVTGAAALICRWLFGASAATSVAIGGGIGTAGGLVMALFAFRGDPSTHPLKATGAFLGAEALKLITTIVLFVIVLTRVQTVPLALLTGYAITFAVPWLALAASMIAPRAARATAAPLLAPATPRP